MKRDEGKTKEQLINELVELRQRITHLEALETERKQMVERLMESEERYRSTLDNMLEGCQIIGYDWRYSYVNDAITRQSHQAKELLLGHTMMEVYPGIENTVMFAALRHCMEKRIPHRMENEFTFLDGTKAWFELSIQPVPEGIFVLSLDITGHKQAEERLVAEKNFSESIISSFPTLFYLFDERGKFLRWNKNFEKITGYSAEEISKMTSLDFFAREEKESIAEKIQEVFKKGSASIEAHLVAKNGKKIAHLFTGVRTRIDNKVCLAGVGMDVTERKQMEGALRQSEETLRRTFESLTDGVLLLDLNGIITECNTTTVQIFGFNNKTEIIGKSAPDLIVQRDRQRMLADMRETSEQGSTYTHEYILLKADGSEFPGEVSGNILTDVSGNVVGFISIVRNITERKKVEEQLMVTDRLASIGELSSGIAHELNNPLTAIIGFSELVLDKDIPDDVKEDLKAINREAQRTAGIVKNLLTFARKHDTAKQPVNISSIIEKVLELRTYEQKVNNIQVNTRFAPDLPEITVDGFQLQQVFLNIIINAEHFMTEAHRKGTLTITTERAGDIIRVSLADDGPGIAKENLGYVFDPFFTTKELGKGTGLGLSISYGIITEHGGRIYAESELGKGATLVVELPISR